MSQFEEIETGVTIAANSSTTITTLVTVTGYDQLDIQLEGDNNSSDLNLNLYARTHPNASLVPYDTSSYTNKDLTNNKNTGEIFLFDVPAVAVVQIELKNNTGNETSVDVYTGKDTHN